MLIYILLFSAGVLLLSYCSDMLIDNSALLGLRLRIRPAVIGMTVVAFGTSLPEFVVSFRAVLYGTVDIAFGNVIGSNISNIGFVLGISALLIPVEIEKSTTRRELPYLLGICLVFYILCLKLRLGAFDGILMISFFFFFLYFTMTGRIHESNGPKTLHVSAKENESIKEAFTTPLYKMLFFLVLGFSGVIYGSKLALDNAVSIAGILGISELVIGLSVIAIGTSLPELATSVAAIIKKQPDIAVGNIVGSNVFNIFFILGFSVFFRPITLSLRSILFETPIMIIFTLFLLAVGIRAGRLTKINGLILLLGFTSYLTALFL